MTFRGLVPRTVAVASLILSAMGAYAGEEKKAPRQPIHYFELTADGFKKYAASIANLERVAPALRKAAEEEDAKGARKHDGSVDAMIAELTRVCETIAPFRSSVTDAGLSCGDWTLTNLTLMQASILAMGYESNGPAFLESFPGGTEPRVKANIEFAQKRKKEIGALVERQQQAFMPAGHH